LRRRNLYSNGGTLIFGLVATILGPGDGYTHDAAASRHGYSWVEGPRALLVFTPKKTTTKMAMCSPMLRVSALMLAASVSQASAVHFGAYDPVFTP